MHGNESGPRAWLITNPRSGRGGIDLAEAVAVLEANGWHVKLRQKTRGGEATKLARKAVEAGCDVVVGCGGDGTLSEIVDGLVGSTVAVGVIPGGTVNLWARELGVSPGPRAAAQQLVTAVRRRIDLGHVEVNGRHGRHFLLMAGLGIDGAVIDRVSKPLKRRVGSLAVVLAGLQALPGLRSIPVQVDLDGTSWAGSVTQILVGNTRLYGGFTRFTPAALVDDALLDICLMTASGPLALSRQAASLVLRKRPDPASAETYRVSHAGVRSAGVVPLQVDGGRVKLKHLSPDAEGVTYRFTTRPGALSVLVPQSYDGGLFRNGLPEFAPLDSSGPNRAWLRSDRCTVRISSTGLDTMSGTDLESGVALTVAIGPDTTAKDALGDRISPSALLANLGTGDLVRVKGKFDQDSGLVHARKLRLRRNGA